MAQEILDGGTLTQLLAEVDKFWSNETPLPPVTLAAMAAILMAHGHTVSFGSGGMKASTILNTAAKIRKHDDSMTVVN